MSEVLTTADLLHAVWPRHTAKLAAQASGSPWETARGWAKRRFKPDADTLLRMVQESRELRAELIRRLGDWDAAEEVRELAPASGQVAGEVGGSDRPAGVASSRVGERAGG